jgi:hypothetical protein
MIAVSWFAALTKTSCSACVQVPLNWIVMLKPDPSAEPLV